MGHNPIAHESGRHGNPHLAILNIPDRHRLEPALISGLADFLAQKAADLIPLRVDKIVAWRTRHSFFLPPNGRRSDGLDF